MLTTYASYRLITSDMGIGLFISRVIIESHGGKIWHEASPGGGAAFCFTLPRIAQDELDHAA